MIIRMKNNFKILVAVFALLFLVGCTDDSISGTITPSEEGVKVQLIQNLSVVAETFTDENGYYEFTDLADEKYGLLFIRSDLVYVYGGLDPDVKETVEFGIYDYGLEKSSAFLNHEVVILYLGDSSSLMSLVEEEEYLILDGGLDWNGGEIFHLSFTGADVLGALKDLNKNPLISHVAMVPSNGESFVERIILLNQREGPLFEEGVIKKIQSGGDDYFIIYLNTHLDEKVSGNSSDWNQKIINNFLDSFPISLEVRSIKESEARLVVRLTEDHLPYLENNSGILLIKSTVRTKKL